MAAKWIATYYITNKFGQMKEADKPFDARLPREEVSVRMKKMLASLAAKGQPVYPDFDLRMENVA